MNVLKLLYIHIYILYIYIYIYISLIWTDSAEFPDFLTLSVPIVHRSWQVF